MIFVTFGVAPAALEVSLGMGMGSSMVSLWQHSTTFSQRLFATLAMVTRCEGSGLSMVRSRRRRAGGLICLSKKVTWG